MALLGDRVAPPGTRMLGNTWKDFPFVEGPQGPGARRDACGAGLNTQSHTVSYFERRFNSGTGCASVATNSDRGCNPEAEWEC